MEVFIIILVLIEFLYHFLTNTDILSDFLQEQPIIVINQNIYIHEQVNYFKKANYFMLIILQKKKLKKQNQ